MTVIVGLEHDGKVTLAADSGAANGHAALPRRDSKLIKVDEQIILAFTDSFRMGHLLRWQLPHRLTLPVSLHEDTVRTWVNTDFIETVRKMLNEYGFSKVENERHEGGAFLLGVKDTLFQIYGDFQVSEAARGWDVNGGGWEVAAGVMLALSEEHPMERLERAVTAACEILSGQCVPPVRVLSTRGA